MECIENLGVVGWSIYRGPIDFDVSFIKHADCFFCWYLKGANKKWTYDLTYHLMVDLKTIVVIKTSMTYTIDLDAYKLHLVNEKVFNKFASKC